MCVHVLAWRTYICRCVCRCVWLNVVVTDRGMKTMRVNRWVDGWMIVWMCGMSPSAISPTLSHHTLDALLTDAPREMSVCTTLRWPYSHANIMGVQHPCCESKGEGEGVCLCVRVRKCLSVCVCVCVCVYERERESEREIICCSLVVAVSTQDAHTHTHTHTKTKTKTALNVPVLWV